MYTKVIYLFYTKIYDFEYDKYGLLLMKDKGLEVEAWSLESIFFEKFHQEKSSFTYNDIIFHDVISYKHFASLVKKQKRKKCIFILQMPVHDLKVNLCEMIIKLLGFEYCMTYCQSQLYEKTVGKLSYSRLKASSIEKILDVLFQPKYNFLATKTNFLDYSSKWRVKKYNNVLIHTLDYDKFLAEKNIPKKISQKYIVFLDEYEPFHPDTEMLSMPNFSRNAEKYYYNLNKLFCELEKIYQCEVVIAEHPRADYSDKEYYLYGRKHFRNITSQLVRDSELVVTHCSLAQDYIVLNKKPFLMIYNTNMRNSSDWYRLFIPSMKFFNSVPLNIEEDYDYNKILKSITKYDKNTYKEFYYRFIMGKEKEKLFFEVVYEKLLKV